MNERYGWNMDHYPIFACAVGYRCEFYGCHCTNAVILTLDAPDEVYRLQSYYDWTDLIFDCEYESSVTESTISNALYNDGHDYVTQVTLPYIKLSWIVGYMSYNQRFGNKHVGSGGNNILEDEWR